MHLITINDRQEFVAYMKKLLFSEESQGIVIKEVGDTTMIKCPSGMWVELSDGEAQALKKRHNVVSNKSGTLDSFLNYNPMFDAPRDPVEAIFSSHRRKESQDAR